VTADIVAALRLSGAKPLGRFDERWLDLLDRHQLTLIFGEVCRDQLPAQVRRRIERRLAANRLRLAKLRREYEAIAEVVGKHVLLKGFSHGTDFLPHPDLRPQYDLDILAADVDAAYEAVRGLGFEPAVGSEGYSTDHRLPLVRKTGWRWRGDFFDPEIPPIVEIHHRFWDPDTEEVALRGLEGFWARREGSRLALADRFGYAALHLLRHLLRGSVKLMHAYELAYFLDRRQDEEFWMNWSEIHSPELRRAEALASRLAAGWFMPRVPDAIQREIAALPAPVLAWFEQYGDRPREDKSEVWLHLELIDGLGAKARVLRRRFFPLTAPGPLEGQYDDAAAGGGLGRMWRYAKHVAARAAHHAATLLKAIPAGLLWSARRSN
jgi:hypothetical protein